jgi:hypothetical protein
VKSSRAKFKCDKRPFKVVSIIVETLNMKAHDSEIKWLYLLKHVVYITILK